MWIIDLEILIESAISTAAEIGATIYRSNR